RAAHFAHLLNISRGFFHTGDVRQRGEPDERVDIDVHAGPPRHVVDHNRELGAVGDGLVMLEQSVGAGFVVIGRDGKQAVRAGTFHQTRSVNSLSGIVSPRASKHRHLPVRFLYTDFDDTGPLVFAQRRALTGGAAGHEEVDAVFDL